ncbi:MAG: glycosyltransferase family 4 protein [Vicinamibacteria bacterium]|nr:glycosyltransferase family 4 protein [Vicinamibacteria bacterium]
MNTLHAAKLPPAPRPESLNLVRHVAWVNEHAAFVGGAEQYVYETARLMASHGVQNTLLYDPLARFDPEFLKPFARAYPLIKPSDQIRALGADVVYLHRVAGAERLHAIAQSTDRAVRFFHDHRALCLREHKYTTLRHHTCTKPIGTGCYACLGFVGSNNGALTLRTLGPLYEELEASRELARTVVASRYLKRHLVAHGFDADRIDVAPLYADRPHAVVVPRDERHLVFVGQLIRGKGVDVLLEAMAHLPKYIRLTIVGSGRQELELLAQADRLGLLSRVHFTGEKRGVDRDRLVASAAALVLPSRSPETFGLVGLEAFRLGTPVVASRVGGIPEWLEEDETGLLVPAGDPVRLARALRLVVDAPGFARTLGERGRESWRARFQPRHHFGRLMAAFSKVIS